MELISPAGSLKKLKYAIEFGADVVYCGIPDFSLRARVNDFNLKTLHQGIDFARSRNKKVYITLNIFPREKHFAKLAEHIKWLRTVKPDALVVSDPGVLVLIKKIWPKANIHLSTQANCINSESAKFWARQGVSRVILARETTLEEIKKIHKAAPKVELECFVHGAMCMSYSGRCLLSQFFTKRSANLGDCTQPCRWSYKMLREPQHDRVLLIEEDDSGSYIMNSKDLCLVEYLRDLAKAGISSFKIEGRSKSIYYVAGVTKVYRAAIDSLVETRHVSSLDKYYIKELKKYQNRGFTTGFLFGKEKCARLRGASAWQGQKTDASHETCEWEFCGEVVGGYEATNHSNVTNLRIIKVLVHNQIFVGDEIEFVPPVGKVFKQKITKIFDKDMKRIKEAHGGQKQEIYLEINKNVPEMTLLRRKIV
ncbi:MAG: U32 family peptidase C-terminal domain-containing protein [Candidatus Falkowbacteria bacterium]